jgi:hypothetical protein
MKDLQEEWQNEYDRKTFFSILVLKLIYAMRSFFIPNQATPRCRKSWHIGNEVRIGNEA